MTDVRIKSNKKDILKEGQDYYKKFHQIASGQLLHASADGTKNALCSPLSLQILLGMILLATEGNTRDQVAEAIGCSKEQH